MPKTFDPKRLCPSRFIMLRDHIDRLREAYPEYEDELLTVSFVMGKHNFHSCDNPTCPGCLADTDVAAYRVLLAIAEVEDGTKPPQTIAELDRSPLIPLLFNRLFKTLTRTQAEEVITVQLTL